MTGENLKELEEIPNIEHVVVDKKSRTRVFLITVKRVSIQGGTRLYTFHDITERKTIEDALRDSEERHRLFYNPSFGGSIIHDKGVILDCSNGLVNMTGYSYDELIGMAGLRLIAPDWRDFVRDKITSGFEEPYEAEGMRKDGTIFPLRLHAKPVQYQGKVARVVEFRDITDIKKAEQALKETLVDLKLAQQIANIGNWQFDPEIGIPVWSGAVYTIYERDPALGPPQVDEYKRIYDEEQHAIFSAAFQRAVREGIPYDIELMLHLPQNRVKWVHVLCRPDEKKGDVGYFLRGTIQDITGRKQLEAEKDALITELEQALARVEKLEGFLPICSFCKKIRDDQGNWQQIETYIHERSVAKFTHSFCPECAMKHYHIDID